MNNIKLNGLADDITCSNLTIEETINDVPSDLINELIGLRDNIQDQIDNISAGITTDTNLSINSLTTASTITATGNITTAGILTTPTIMLNGANLSTTLNGKQPLITGGTVLTVNDIVSGGNSLNGLISIKQNQILSSSNITLSVLTANNINLAGAMLSQTINNINGSLDAKLNSIAIGTVTTLDAGSQATATVSTANNVSTLNLGIPTGLSGGNGFNGAQGAQGDAGPKGDKGDTGSAGSSPDVLAIIATILTSGTILGALAAIAALEAQILTMQGQITAIDIEIATLQAKTLYQSVVGTATRFTSNLQINDGMYNDVILKRGEKSEFYYGINTGDDVSVAGSITATEAISTDGNISTSSNLIINGNTTLGSSVINNTHTITGNTLDVNCAFINLNGFVSGSFFTSNYFNQLGF